MDLQWSLDPDTVSDVRLNDWIRQLSARLHKTQQRKKRFKQVYKKIKEVTRNRYHGNRTCPFVVTTTSCSHQQHQLFGLFFIGINFYQTLPPFTTVAIQESTFFVCYQMQLLSH